MGVWISWMVEAARATGYPVVVVPGWQSRGHGPYRLLEGVVGHHTGTPESAAGDYPTLRVVRDGRTGLAGPLCGYGLGRSGTIYVVAAGVAYHAGASAHAGFVDLNDEFVGIEAEDSGDGKWTSEQLDCYPKLVAQILRYMNRGVDRYVSHRTCARPAGRKPDPAGISDSWMRERAAAALRGGGGGGGGTPASRKIRGDEVASIHSYGPTLDAAGKLMTQSHTFVLPVGSTSLMTARAWISFKCMNRPGTAEYVRFMSIASGKPPKYLGDKEWKNVVADEDRPAIQAGDGQDQFVAYVRSAVPYSICIEMDPK